ncbi:MAG TPA: ATP-binding protein [Noviherbaspirillum sp.]|nr:ATP-binding protein [Noviherbaspirillum sp.]
MTGKFFLRLLLVLAALLGTLSWGAAYFSQFMAPSGRTESLTPSVDTLRVPPYGQRSDCTASSRLPAPPHSSIGNSTSPIRKSDSLFSDNAFWGQHFRISATESMERIFLVESSQLLSARLFVEGSDGNWHEASRWPKSRAQGGGFYVNPAYTVRFEAGQETRLFVCYQTISGMTPLFSIRTIDSVMERLAFHLLVFGAMLSILPFTLLYASSFWKTSREETIPLILFLVPLGGAYSGWIMGLHTLIFPDNDVVTAAKIAHTSIMVSLVLFLHYLLREHGAGKEKRPVFWLRRLFPFGALLPLPIILLDYKLGQDLLILVGTLLSFVMLVGGIALLEKDRYAVGYAVIGILAMLICLSYAFTWFDLLPSDVVTALTATLGTAFAGYFGLIILRRFHERDLYLIARVNYSDRIYRREARRHTAARLRAFSTINHDMRQPVHVIEASLAALQNHVRDPATRRILDRLIRANETLSGFVDGLLDVSRIDAGVMAPRVQIFSVDMLLSQLATEYRDMATAKGLALRYVGCRAYIHSDPALLERILRNLLSNAINNTETGRILLGCRRRPGHTIDIQVIDTGPGIDAATRNRLFSTGLRPPGKSGRSGLGLFIVTELAAVLDHRIGLESEPGVGSCFSVTAKLAPANAEKQPALKNPDIPMLQGLSVLLMEGPSRSSASLRRLLEEKHLTVLEAATRREALNLLASGHVPDLAIVHHLPQGKTGLDLIEHLEHTLMRPIPTIVIVDSLETKDVLAIERLDRLLICSPVENAELFRSIGALTNPGRQAPIGKQPESRHQPEDTGQSEANEKTGGPETGSPN